MELILREYYRNHQERELDQPHRFEEVADVLELLAQGTEDPRVIRQHVQETAFIEEDMDCSFVRHPRYLPAIWHENEFFEMLYVIHGQGTACVPDGSLSMQAGNICIFAPHTLHAVSAFHDDDRLINMIIRYSTFEKYFFGLLEGDDILSSFFRRAFYRSGELQYLFFRTGEDEHLRSMVEEAHAEYISHNRFRRQMLNAQLSQIFIVLFRRHENDVVLPRQNSADTNSDIIYILHYIQEHYRDITLHRLSELFSYSERQLQRNIEKATGKNFRELIRDQKMSRATALLLNSSLSISEISSEVGYPSENNFRRIFEAVYGMSPGRYRRQRKQT